MEINMPELIYDRVNKILNRTTETYRDKLDKMYHVVDFTFGALKASAPDLTEAEYNALLVEVRSRYKNYSSLEIALERIRDTKNHATTSALVEDENFGTYIVGYSYGAVQSKLASILKNVEHTKVFTDTDAKGTTVTNIGHIPGRESPALVSPLSAKILDAVKVVPAGQPRMGLLRGLSKLYNAHIFNVKYAFQRENFDIKKFNNILGKNTLLVTLQTKDRNMEFANKVEAVLAQELRSLVLDAGFLGQLINSKGSRSIKEEVIHQVVSTLRGEKPKAEVHDKKSAPSKTIVVKTKIKVTPLVPKIRTADTKRFTRFSPVNISNLLNFHLHDVVAANMGDGNATRILNYRTGRFATSTQVDRVSISRDNAVTAFYSYMKYPYATFAPGGKQQYPRSRDPNILISKSIRQIATKMMIENLRIVES